MKIGVKSALLGALACVIATPAFASGELHIYTFGDYLSPDAVNKFAKENDVKVSVNTYDSNDDMMQKISAGGSGYDIAIGGNWIIPHIIEMGLAVKTEPNQMPNYQYVRPAFKSVSWDDGRHYTIPFLWGTTGFTVNKEFYKGPLDSWSLVFNPPKELDGHINVVPETEDMINSISFYKGIKPCSADKNDLKTIRDTLAAAKPHFQAISYSVIDGMVSKQFYETVNWNGSSMRARLQNGDITYVYPKEGMVSWFDSLFVVKNAPNLENAKKFQNFLMKPENAALLTTFAHYDNGIVREGQMLPPEFKDAPEFADKPNGKDPVFVAACSQEVAKLHGQIWDSVMK